MSKFFLFGGLLVLTFASATIAAVQPSSIMQKTTLLQSRMLTPSDIASITADITTAFALVPSYGTSCNAKVSPCPLGDNIGALVRLTFHDAAGNGGPNGCIDFSTPANNGLQDVVAALDDLYNAKNYSGLISKADLYVLAGNVAIQYASTTASTHGRQVLDPSPGPLILPFRYGRSDVTSCDDNGSLPSASDAWAQLKTLFIDRFGFNIPESVAIMGAHSVGRCQYANSGFDGGWTAFQSSFSNEYFKTMGDVGWINNNSSDVWIGGAQNLLLKVDAELLYGTFDSSRGYCSAFKNFQSSARCPIQGQSHVAFMAYANNVTGNTYFYGNFTTAWQKMTEYNISGTNGASFLAEVGAPLTVAYPAVLAAPTLAPTADATAPPSIKPSSGPSAGPSAVPTVPPSRMPSNPPTKKPSSEPSANPSAGPTVTPTSKPTTIPSTNPTAKPSTAPTTGPTKSPSFLPTTKPSTLQTTEPSKVPTVPPSAKPSSTTTPTKSRRGAVVTEVAATEKDGMSMRGFAGSRDVADTVAMPHKHDSAPTNPTIAVVKAASGFIRGLVSSPHKVQATAKAREEKDVPTNGDEGVTNPLAALATTLRKLFSNKR